MKVFDCVSGNYYNMWSTSYEWEWTGDRKLRVQVNEDDAELIVSYIDEDGDQSFLKDTEKDFWVGAVLYWYDAMSLGINGRSLHRLQVDSVARLAQWLGYVPHEDYIIKYAVPNAQEALSYHEQINRLAADNFEFAVNLKRHREEFKNAEGAD